MNQPPQTDTAVEKFALVLGLGYSGLSCIEYLRESGFKVRVADTRQPAPNATKMRDRFADVSLCEGPFVSRLLDGIQLLALSPGISVHDPLVEEAQRRGIDVVGDIELFARQLNQDSQDDECEPSSVSVIGITGSNGKSTVTALLGHILNAAKINAVVAGNIGRPVLTLCRDKQAMCEAQVYVLELSSFQLETVSNLRLKAATLLNLSEDHLDRHVTLQAYTSAKSRIFNHADQVVINRDDVQASNCVPEALPALSIGTDAPASDCDYGLINRASDNLADDATVSWITRGSTPLMSVDESPLPGKHNALNIMAALALASVLDVDCEVAVQAVRTFEGLPHRMQTVSQIDDVVWINDSKGTNVGATLAAVKGLNKPIVLIVGGQAKGQDFRPLIDAAQGRVRELVVIGEDAQQIITATRNTSSPLVSYHASTLADAVDHSARQAQPGDVVLFSPACASFDMFENFGARGRAFCELVLARSSQQGLTS